MSFLDKMKQILYGHEDFSILDRMEGDLYQRLSNGRRVQTLKSYDPTVLAVYLLTLEQNYQEAQCAASAYEIAYRAADEELGRLRTYKDTLDLIAARVNDDDNYLD